MAHSRHPSAYTRLAARLNRFPQGAPASDLLFSILKLLFSEKEAGLVALLPIRPFTVHDACRAWKTDISAAGRVLDGLAARALLVDIPENGRRYYCLPPPMAGFFEFSLMRVRRDIDQETLSELLYQYLNVEEDFIKALFLDGQTPLGRVFVQEPALSAENALLVLDYERAGEVIGTASHIGIGLCYCRHKMAHVGRDCSAPKEICMTFNTTAASLIKYGHARPVDAAECRDLLDRAYAANLVQFGENVQRRVNFICNCCGCCCEALLATQRLGLVRPIHTNFLARIKNADCIGCGRCAQVCPVRAINGFENRGGPKSFVVDASMCLGCGVCIRNCPTGAIGLDSRPRRVLTPVDTVRRSVLMAIERGTLQHMIFDNQVLHSHRSLAAILGVILRLPPVKRMLAAGLLQSRYVNTLLDQLTGK
jgi:ferredoxin